MILQHKMTKGFFLSHQKLEKNRIKKEKILFLS